MGKYKRIPRDAWNSATIVLRRYPANKLEYKDLFDNATTADPEYKSYGAKPPHSDPTQAKAIRLVSDRRIARVEREVQAVEEAIKGLGTQELAVISKRYWSGSTRKGRPIPYDIIDAPYSVSAMKMICWRVLYKVALYIGEL